MSHSLRAAGTASTCTRAPVPAAAAQPPPGRGGGGRRELVTSPAQPTHVRAGAAGGVEGGGSGCARWGWSLQQPLPPPPAGGAVWAGRGRPRDAPSVPLSHPPPCPGPQVPTATAHKAGMGEFAPSLEKEESLLVPSFPFFLSHACCQRWTGTCQLFKCAQHHRITVYLFVSGWGREAGCLLENGVGHLPRCLSLKRRKLADQADTFF
ncbi:hypothetical protein KIL84_000873 [Mauremys mutica]|uniref:Uncharacterized protein n=1 Tax=Mauremys mutica TaxID=74926 RepID=A0A9D4AT69_9SAUR|nr:hypothetical protein KIL84_000873 [Mauremys mutica]